MMKDEIWLLNIHVWSELARYPESQAHKLEVQDPPAVVPPCLSGHWRSDVHASPIFAATKGIQLYVKKLTH